MTVQDLLAAHPQLRALTPSRLGEVAQAFETLMPEYFLNQLGAPLLADTYWRVFCDDPNCFGFVWLDDDRVVGFVAGTTRRDQFLRRVIARAPLRFAVGVFVTALRSPRFIKQCLGLLSTLWHEGRREGPAAELMSLGVLPRALRPVSGETLAISPARVLMAAATVSMRDRSATAFRLYTGGTNRLASNFSKRMGFAD